MSEHNTHASAHHVEEFGDVNFVSKEAPPDDGSAVRSLSALPSHLRRLRRRLVRKRQLQQHFVGDTLYRTAGMRTVSQDELFLDLIIVAAVAGIGHELRETFTGWPELEKFLLLFGAVYSSWRALVIYWNLWGVSGDMGDKFVVYLTFTLLTAIGAGAHAAFTAARPYVAVASFFATAIPLAFNIVFAMKEPLLNAKNNVINQSAFFSGCQMVSTVPYLAAAFVPSARAARILFWIPPFAQVVTTFVAVKAFRYLHRDVENYTRFAVNIELMAEKYEVLTLIVLGESLLAILFEAAKFILKDTARVGLLFAAVIGATALVYSLQTLYVNVDNKIVKGGKHAIRHNSMLGFLWGTIHQPYHICLVLLATGIGILFRDIIVKPGAVTSSAKAVAPAAETAAHFVVRAAAASDKGGGPEFERAERWLFSVGWGGSMFLSAMLAATHAKGPRDSTKNARLVFRAGLAIALGVGMPFAKITAGGYLLVHALMTAVVVFVEFILVQSDSINIIRRLRLGARPEPDTPVDSYDDDSYSDSEDDLKELEGDDGPVKPDTQNPASPDPEAQEARSTECRAAHALRCRMRQRGRHQMEKVEASDKRRQCTLFSQM